MRRNPLLCFLLFLQFVNGQVAVVSTWELHRESRQLEDLLEPLIPKPENQELLQPAEEKIEDIAEENQNVAAHDIPNIEGPGLAIEEPLFPPHNEEPVVPNLAPVDPPGNEHHIEAQTDDSSAVGSGVVLVLVIGAIVSTMYCCCVRRNTKTRPSIHKGIRGATIGRSDGNYIEMRNEV